MTSKNEPGTSGGSQDRVVENGVPEEGLPGIDFATFVLSLSHSALVYLGDAPSPEGRAEHNLPLARQTIDLLTILQEKTKNNLTGEEERLLDQALLDLRLRFVEISRRT